MTRILPGKKSGGSRWSWSTRERTEEREVWGRGGKCASTVMSAGCQGSRGLQRSHIQRFSFFYDFPYGVECFGHGCSVPLGAG